MKLVRSILVIAVIGLIAGFMFSSPQEMERGAFIKHFESNCDTLIAGTDTIYNCYVRCSNPPLARDTVWPLGEYKYIEATVTYDTGAVAGTDDSLWFQVQNPRTGVWSNIGVYDLGTADLPYIVNVTGSGSSVKRYRLGIPYPLKPRAVCANSLFIAGRKIMITWEGAGE